MKVDNAIIMSAGTASRFAPLSYELPKALIEVRGEVLIERQIRQLLEAGIKEIVVVVGYKAEKFEYLKNKYGVKLIYNPYYLTRNNNSSIYVAKSYLKNSYICSSDNYFVDNPFEKEVSESYYAAVYKQGKTNEWCITDENGWIKKVTVGGADSWVMLGHVFWTEMFSEKFISILDEKYDEEKTKDKLWESIYIEHIKELPMRIRKYKPGFIFEFDTLDELRLFDNTYIYNTRSDIIKYISNELGLGEDKITHIKAFKDIDNTAAGFIFNVDRKRYKYFYNTHELEEIGNVK